MDSGEPSTYSRTSVSTPSSLHEIFRVLPSRLDSEAAEGLTAVYQFDLGEPQGAQYHLTIEDGTCTVTQGAHPDPHVILSMSGEDAIKILSGQLSGQMAAMSGRLSVSGDLGLAMQLKGLFPSMGTP